MSTTIPGLVQTSTNLSSLKVEGHSLIIANFQRSVIESEKREATEMIADLTRGCDATINMKSEYPGWTPDIASPLLQTAVTMYEKTVRHGACDHRNPRRT